jgi:hypothetical protein
MRRAGFEPANPLGSDLKSAFMFSKIRNTLPAIKGCCMSPYRSDYITTLSIIW